MKVIVGLGNVGTKYDCTRHNAGFMAIDNFAFTNQLGSFESKTKFNAEVMEAEMSEERLLLVKPSTFMNRSGDSLVRIKRYFSVDSATTLVIYDDVDLEFGSIRVRVGGGSGGHNGIRSLPGPVQENAFRIRIGVKNPQKDTDDTADFVLSQFLPEEAEQLPAIFTKTNELIENFVTNSIQEQTIHPAQ